MSLAFEVGAKSPHRERRLVPPLRLLLLAAGVLSFTAGFVRAEQGPEPYTRQAGEHRAKLAAADPLTRARGAEALGFLRAYAAEPDLIASLADPIPEVRRQAALALGWCGGRPAIEKLLAALDDPDWLARQAAHVALTNLTGMEFSFHASADDAQRAQQTQQWRAWWVGVPADAPPTDVLALLGAKPKPTSEWTASASTTYRGPPEVLLDGELEPAYWQTKNVKPPQWLQIDLGRAQDVRQMTVHQYGPGFCMTEYEVSTSLDGKKFDSAGRRKGVTPVKLVVNFPPRKARYVRITSYGAEKKIFPTTLREIEINGQRAGGAAGKDADALWRRERGLRALGVLGGKGVSATIIAHLGARPSGVPANRPAVRAGIRSLGRLCDPAALAYLLSLLENPMWARNAADALGDFGDPRAVPALLAAYQRFARPLGGGDPPEVPSDDLMKFPSEDRMLETPYWIIYALCRLPIDKPDDLKTLRKLAPRLAANLPGDHDAMMLYQPEPGHTLTRWLLDRCAVRQEAVEQAMAALGQPRRARCPDSSLVWSKYAPRRMATWLPCACTERADLPRLLALLEHKDGWVRINAAKTVGWLKDPRAVAPLAKILATAKNEAAYGYAKNFKEEEFNDPAPRWREAIVRALGQLPAQEHAPLIVGVLNDEGSVLEVRRAAADALAELGGATALAALKRAAREHSYATVRQAAIDGLAAHGLAPSPASDVFAESSPVTSAAADASTPPGVFPSQFEALVFLKGDNNLPTTWKTIEPEQADHWRQTYAVTDEGPSYRPADNLYVLRPPRPDGRVTPLTTFRDGYVAEPEVTWDGRSVLFIRREAASQWWHIWRVNVDGSGLRQLTEGPYHDLGPVQLADGRIAFPSSRSGLRDEYHGYLCTALYVMNADGGDMHRIATNIGRDNEPALLADGRLAFSRLEVFYSRNKTELTLHAAFPDGTHDTVLYGPERRQFWRSLDHGAPDPADKQEAPLTHRVLRVTQPQTMADGRRIVVATQGGFTLLDGRRDAERLISPDFKTRAYTTPCPLADGSLLCATTDKTPDRMKVDLGLYRFYPQSGRLELIYNDPKTADYEARPIAPRRAPPLLPSTGNRSATSGRFFCASVFNSQDRAVPQRGRLVRLIEGVPIVGRHATHTGVDTVWKNHGGTLARVLGMAPLASDGSFYVELPADRLVHLQVLDSDRQVVGNQLTWIYARPGETKSCAGCHENPHATPPTNNPLALHAPPLSMLPRGDEFSYRAKAWIKGHLPPEVEERTRTVHAVNLLGR